MVGERLNFRRAFAFPFIFVAAMTAHRTILLSSPGAGMVASFQPTRQQRQRLPCAPPGRSVLSVGATEEASSTLSSGSPPPTLTEATTWTMRMVLDDVPTAKGKKLKNAIFAVKAKFVEDENYEPPQGSIRQVLDGPASSSNSNSVDGQESDGDEGDTSPIAISSPQMTIKSGSFRLSEDPNERKDGLWIWGLFKEPLYPFLLLQFETDSIDLPGEEGDSIQPLTLFAQIDHKRGDNGEVILSAASDLTVKRKETFKADPFGAATVDVFEEISVGKLQLRPVVPE